METLAEGIARLTAWQLDGAQEPLDPDFLDELEEQLRPMLRMVEALKARGGAYSVIK
jgi:hypothetical protein